MATTTETARATYGGFWARFLAIVLDWIIIGIMSSALGALVGAGTVVTTQTAGGVQVNVAANAMATLVGLVYFVGFWSFRNGQTPGMIPFRMRVVKASDGTAPDWVVSLLRYAGLIISMAAIFIGVIWAAFDSRKQGWHDKIAGTLVLREPA
jgi:uncharacterized RDD family membrane protein YckC